MGLFRIFGFSIVRVIGFFIFTTRDPGGYVIVNATTAIRTPEQTSGNLFVVRCSVADFLFLSRGVRGNLIFQSFGMRVGFRTTFIDVEQRTIPCAAFIRYYRARTGLTNFGSVEVGRLVSSTFVYRDSFPTEAFVNVFGKGRLYFTYFVDQYEGRVVLDQVFEIVQYRHGFLYARYSVGTVF